MIGPDYIVYSNGNSVSSAINAVRTAIDDFDFIVTNPVSNQIITYNETIDIDVSDVFACESGSYEISLEDGYNSNPEASSVSFDGTTLTINTNSILAITEITITGTSYNGLARTNTFSVIINDPIAASYSDDFETGVFSSDWSFSGYGDHWSIVPDSKDGYIAKSGATNNYLQSAIFLVDEFTETSAVKFKYKTSSESADVLRFKIDGTILGEWSGENNWTEVTFVVGDAGEHEIKWEYAKSNSGSAGEDCVWIDNIYFSGLPRVGIDDNYELAVTNYELKQNYPNPFNPCTTINFTSMTLSDLSSAEIVVSNAMGQEIWYSKPLSLNTNHCTFNGSSFNSGIYYYSLIIDGKRIDTKSMLLIK